MSDFTFIARLDKGDQRLFQHKKDGRYCIADNSGKYPEGTDDGPMFVHTKKPLSIGDRYVTIPVYEARDSDIPDLYAYHCGTTFKGARKLLEYIDMEVVTEKHVNKDRLWLLERAKVIQKA